MGEEKDPEMSFSNAVYDASDVNLTEKPQEKSKTTTIIILLIILACSLGAGIGIGFVIGEDKSTQEENFEPIVGETTPTPNEEPVPTESQGPPTLEDWIDRPCTDSGPICPAGVSSPPVLLISLDGFRADYLNRSLTPVLNRMAECGASTPYMIPSFPSLTFPNHYTLATGMYPEAHGIVGNTMYETDGSKFSIGSAESGNRKWWGGEPIWNTARWQGKKSAAFFWVGSDVDIQGIYPNYWNKYDGEVNYIQRVDTVLGWLRLPDGYRPDITTLYFDEPDHAGHDPGPDSPEENEIINRMDGQIRRLMDGLLAMGMIDCVNVIVVADHGMADRTCDNLFVLNDHLPSSDYRIISTAGTMLRMEPNNDATVSDPEEVVESLLCKDDVAIPYVKEDLPKRWHYVNNDRIEPIEVTVPEQWTASGGSTTYCEGGTHGYDNLGVLMRALFIAHGPGFKSQYRADPFENIELYNMMCELIDVEPAPNNGTIGSLHHIMRSPKHYHPPTPTPMNDSDCPYPATDNDYNDRLDDDQSNCECNMPDVKTYDEQLKLSVSEVEMSMAMHTPLGAPLVTFDTDYCHLAQNDYVTGYSHDLRTPLWTSFTLREPQTTDRVPVMTQCPVRPDVRVPADFSASCSDYDNLSGKMADLETGYLFHPVLASSNEAEMDALITSNIVPQHDGFMTDIWDGFLFKQLPHWANQATEINVVTGPIFDFDGDGFVDSNDTRDDDGITFGDSATLLPTHYFMIVSRCQGGGAFDSACSKLESASFILRNSDGIRTCQTQADYMEHHVAKIQDIEKLTGLVFYPESGLSRGRSIRHKLYLPIKGDLWMNWPLTS